MFAAAVGVRIESVRLHTAFCKDELSPETSPEPVQFRGPVDGGDVVYEETPAMRRQREWAGDRRVNLGSLDLDDPLKLDVPLEHERIRLWVDGDGVGRASIDL